MKIADLHPQRRIVADLFAQGLTYGQIAAGTGKSLNNVGVTISQIRAKWPDLIPYRPRPAKPRLTIASLDIPKKTEADIAAWWKARGF